MSENNKGIKQYSVDENFSYMDNVSVKTNFLILFKFLKIMVVKFNLFLEYFKQFQDSFSSDKLTETVLENIHSIKIIIEVNLNTDIGNSIQVTNNGKIFIVKRETSNKFIITRMEEGWLTDNFIIQCKLDNGHIVYPSIISTGESVELIFDDSYLKNINKILKIYIL